MSAQCQQHAEINHDPSIFSPLINEDICDYISAY